MKENIEPINKDDYFLDENENPINQRIDEVGLTNIPKPKSKKQWYKTTSVEDYITGKSDETIFGRGAKSLERAAKDYQHLSEDFSRHVYSPKFMARKYDKFGGIDLDLIELSIKNSEKEYNSAKTKFESGEISEKEFNKITEKYQKTLNNLNENYKSLYEVWHGKNDIPLVRTQSSVSSLPFMLGTIGFPAAIIGGIESLPFIGSAGSWLANLSRTGIQNKFVKDMLVGSTIGMTGDQLVREFTPYNGVADGLVKQGAKLYYDLKYPDVDMTGETWENYRTKEGKIDWDVAFKDYFKQAKINENKDYQNFLNGNAYLPLTFAAEFLNPANWVNPASAASKIGLSRTFDNLGNELINGIFIDPTNQLKRNQQIWKSGHIEVENETPQAVFDLFKNNKHLQSISDVYHGARYTRHNDGISVGDIDNWSGTYIDNPNDVIIAPEIEMNPEGYAKLLDITSDLPERRQIMLSGNIFNARHGYNSPRPITSNWNLTPEHNIAASDNYKNQVLQNIDNQLNQIAQGEFNGKHLSLPLLKRMRDQIAEQPLFVNQKNLIDLDGGEIIDIHSQNPEIRAFLSHNDQLSYVNGKLKNVRLDNTRTQIPITLVADSPTKIRLSKDAFNPNRSWTYFDGMVIKHEPKTTLDQNPSGNFTLKPGWIDDVIHTYSTGLNQHDDVIGGYINRNNITRTLANTIDNPNSLDLVDINGNVNISAYNNVKKKLSEVLGKSEGEINKLFSEGRYTTEGVNSLDNHLLQVARSAQELPLPQGYTRQEAVTAALLHDLGKVINSSKLHGHSSVDLIDQLGIQINNPKVRNAIKHHMDSPEMNLFGMEGNTNFKGDEIDTNFASFLHLADVARGASLEDTKFYFPHLFSYNYPKGTVLKGDPAEQMGKLNSILTDIGYDGIDTSLPIEQQWSQLQANMKRMNTFIRGSRAYFDPNDEAAHVRNYQNAQYLAKQRGLDPDNPKDVWTVMQEQISMEPTGHGRLMLFDSGNKTNPFHKIAKNTWSDAAAISPEKMDGLYFSVSPETGNTYMTASNINAHSAQSTILRGELSDYDIIPDESPFEYFERLYPFMHRYQTASDYQNVINPLSEFNQNVANTLLGRTINNTSKSDAVAILKKHFPHSDFMKIMNAGIGESPSLNIQDVAHSLTSIPQSTFDLYEKYGFSKLDAVLNNLTTAPQIQVKASVVDLPNYRNNIILNTNGTLYEPGSSWMGKDFQGIVVAPKGKKVFTVLDEIDVNGFPKSSSKAFRDAGGNNVREGLKINIPIYKDGNKIWKKQ